MPLEHRRRDAVDRRAVGDVAHLVLAVELLGECAEPVLAPREQDAAEPAPRELPGDRRPDPARRAGDDRYLQRRTASLALARRPAAVVATAVSTCFPSFALPARQSAT
jgi:hypothetical protein